MKILAIVYQRSKEGIALIMPPDPGAGECSFHEGLERLIAVGKVLTKAYEDIMRDADAVTPLAKQLGQRMNDLRATIVEIENTVPVDA